MKLTDRKREILREVITRFIVSAEPVSSQCIAENCGFEISSATIRKELAELEEMGYLSHPHTSAGRVPSDKGYRFFVDNFISISPSSISSSRIGPSGITSSSASSSKAALQAGADIPSIKLDAGSEMDIEAVLKRSSEQLADLTNYLSMIVAPAIYHSRFKHLEILKLGQDNFLLVLITDTGRVYKRNFLLDGGPYHSLDFQSVSNLLNSQLRDRNISEIEFEKLKISEKDSFLIPLIKKIVELIKSCLQERMLYNRIFINGASSVLNQPDFIDLKKIQRILRIIGNEYLLMNMLLNLSDEQEFVIKIGSEFFEEGLDDLSLVASRYKIYEHATGAIGVLGPKRMDYYRVVSIINAFVKNLRTIFS